MGINGMNLMRSDDGTSFSVVVLTPTMSTGKILNRKLPLADEFAIMMDERVLMGQILGKINYGDVNDVGKEKKKCPIEK